MDRESIYNQIDNMRENYDTCLTEAIVDYIIDKEKQDKKDLLDRLNIGYYSDTIRQLNKEQLLDVILTIMHHEQIERQPLQEVKDNG